MSLTSTHWGRLNFCAAALALLGSACAGEPAAMRDEGIDKSEVRCAHDETLSCVERMGRTVSCTCSSRDDLRDILEPVPR